MNTYIIAEAGVNHNGSLELAKKLVNEAAVAGADAITNLPLLYRAGKSGVNFILSTGISTLGEIEEALNITVKRPGNGLHPSAYWSLLGQPASRSYNTDDLIQ